VSYVFPLALPVLGVPVLGKHNPYLVLVSPQLLVEVEVEVWEDEQPRASVEGLRLGWRFELALKSFVDALSARLEQPVAVALRARVEGVEYPPAASIYAAATLAIVRAVAEAGGYELSSEEVYEAASGIDRDAAVWLDYLDGLRAAMLRGESLVFREGEDPVPLGLGDRVVLELVGEQDIGEDYSARMGDALLSAAARLAGVSVLSAVSALQRREARLVDVFPVAARVEDGLFYSLYGAEPAGEGCKLTPSLQRVYGVCLEGKGLGDRVEFSL
jgi:hypothetical protein